MIVLTGDFGFGVVGGVEGAGLLEPRVVIVVDTNKVMTLFVRH